MNIRFRHCCIDAELLPILQTVIDRGLNHCVIDRFQRGRPQPIERLVERIMSGHELAR